MGNRFVSRAATPRDYPRFVQLFPELGIDDPVPDERRWAADFMPTALVVDDEAEPNGSCVGYAYYELLDTTGYVRNLIVAPRARRRGVGRVAMVALAELFRMSGCDEWCLNVKTDNIAAIGLYESVGMTVAYRSAALRLPRHDVTRLPAMDVSVAVHALAADRDAEVERLFGMPPGQLASLRGRVNETLLHLVDAAGVTLGVARFNPEFPGAFPFRVTEPRAARALLEHMRDAADPRRGPLRLGVEDDVALVATLVDAGASLVMDLYHMRGALPPV